MNNRRNIVINILVISLAAILSLGAGGSCCLSYGYGLGDVFFLFPLWAISIIYLLILIFTRRQFFTSIVPPLIFGCILLVFIFLLIFVRGSECPCSWY